jgi:hypothetical protein
MRRVLTIIAAGAAALVFGAAPAFADNGPTTNTNGASLLNLQDVLNNNNIGVCSNAINVLGVQVPVDADGAQGLLGILTVGSPQAGANVSPSTCAVQNSDVDG